VGHNIPLSWCAARGGDTSMGVKCMSACNTPKSRMLIQKGVKYRITHTHKTIQDLYIYLTISMLHRE
jgi:hypothetical protein